MAAGSSDSYEVTERTKVQRLKARAVYDREAVHAILDEAFIAHVGFVRDGVPLVLPIAYVRIGETLYLHGSITNGMLKTMKGGVDVCVTVTLTDGIVVARTAFHHSLNYRSVVAMGKAYPVTDADEKAAILEAVTEHLLPGRTSEVRANSKTELSATAVLALDLVEVSAKVRMGMPKDEEKDYSLREVWAGILPFAPLKTLAPIDDDRLIEGIKPPPSVTDYKRPVSEH